MHGGLGKSNAVSRRLRRRINNTDAISQPRCGVDGRKFYRGKGERRGRRICGLLQSQTY